MDFSGTDFSFLESPAFLLVVFVLALGSYALGRRQQRVPEAAMLALGAVLGALLFAGSLADGHHTSWPGIVGGIACAALGYFALASLFARARRRVADASGAVALLGLYADGIALALAGLSILFPPIAYAALVVFLVLIVRSRSESAQKYEGLRSLR